MLLAGDHADQDWIHEDRVLHTGPPQWPKWLVQLPHNQSWLVHTIIMACIQHVSSGVCLLAVPSSKHAQWKGQSNHMILHGKEHVHVEDTPDFFSKIISSFFKSDAAGWYQGHHLVFGVTAFHETGNHSFHVCNCFWSCENFTTYSVDRFHGPFSVQC